MKRCYRCKEVLGKDNFSPGEYKKSSARCRQCGIDARMEYVASEGARKEENCIVCGKSLDGKSRNARTCSRRCVGRRANLRNKFNMSVEQWNKMFEAQGRCCANPGCRATEHGSKFWHVDHDRSCCPGDRSCGDCIRGILCAGCNLALGFVNDNTDVLLGLVDYLAKGELK